MAISMVWLTIINIDPNTLHTYFIHQFFHGLNVIIFSQCKIHRNIQHLFKLANFTEYNRAMISTNVEKLVNKIGGHGVGINNYSCQPYPENWPFLVDILFHFTKLMLLLTGL